MDPITQQVVLAAAGAAGGEAYWIATLGASSADFAQAIDVDNLGNVYICGTHDTGGSAGEDISLAKYNDSGLLQWQRQLGGTSNDEGHGLAVDGSGNCCITGRDSSSTGNPSDRIVAKYNTSGAIQWQRGFGQGADEKGLAVVVDSSGNVYVTGNTKDPSDGNNKAFIAKYNSSGTIQWQRQLSGSGSEIGNGIALDSSNNAYVVLSTNSQGSGSSDAVIAKYNSSGTIQWQRILGGSGSDLPYGVSIDSSGNAYIIGYTRSEGPGSAAWLIAKYNTSGDIQWQRTFGGSGFDIGNGVDVDSSGNVYVAGNLGPGSAHAVAIVKYNSSGTIQWQRSLVVSGGYPQISGIVVSDDNVYVAGRTGSPSSMLIAKFPSDGSLTGTYGSFVYAASSYTDASASLNSGTSTLTDSSLSGSGSTTSLTDSASGMTSSTTTL